MRLILSGGGSARDSRPLDERFAEWIRPRARLLYLPFALPDDDPLLPGCEEWIRSVFRPLGVKHIETWHSIDLSKLPTARLGERLPEFDGVYLGGGNPFRLIHLLRSVKLDMALTAYAEAGGPVSGGSAGAVVMGRDIAVSELIGDQDIVGMTDTRGLDLLPGYDVLPHFRPSLTSAIRAYVQSAGAGVFALPERGGLIVHGTERQDAGYEPVRVYHPS